MLVLITDTEISSLVCDRELDSLWGVMWSETPAGSMDFQPCPSFPNSGATNGKPAIVKLQQVCDYAFLYSRSGSKAV